MIMMIQIVKWLWWVKQSNDYDESNGQIIMIGQIVKWLW
jgi:hypothetical protein